jgi:hypothetical protein
MKIAIKLWHPNLRPEDGIIGSIQTTHPKSEN